MKFTFASLLLLLVHALTGVPVAAETSRDAASAEVNRAFGAGEDAGFHLDMTWESAVTSCQLSCGSALAGSHTAAFASSRQAEPVPLRQLTQPLPGERSFDLPLHWGSGDRLALDEGKP